MIMIQRLFFKENGSHLWLVLHIDEFPQWLLCLSGLTAQFYVNQAERKCSQARKEHSDKIQKQQRSVIYG